jgi:hypothetical protein
LFFKIKIKIKIKIKRSQPAAAPTGGIFFGGGICEKKMDLCANVDGHNLNPLWIVPAGLVRLGSSAA